MTARLPASTPRATRSARPTSRVQIEPDRPYVGVVGQRDRVGLVVERQHRRPPGRRPPRATPVAGADAAATHGRRHTRSRRPVGRGARGTRPSAPSERSDGHRVALAGARSAGPSRVASSARVDHPTPRDRRLEQLQELVVARCAAPGSASARSSPGRRCRTRRTARRGRRLLEVGVGEDDVGALAAELEGHPLHLVGAAAP